MRRTGPARPVCASPLPVRSSASRASPVAAGGSADDRATIPDAAHERQGANAAKMRGMTATTQTRRAMPHVRDSGGTGTGVVCLHANASSSSQWRHLSELLAPRFRVLAADLYGAGASPEWPSHRVITLADEVALLEPVLAAAGSPLVLVGHSYGAAVALIAALGRPAPRRRARALRADAVRAHRPDFGAAERRRRHPRRGRRRVGRARRRQPVRRGAPFHRLLERRRQLGTHPRAAQAPARGASRQRAALGPCVARRSDAARRVRLARHAGAVPLGEALDRIGARRDAPAGAHAAACRARRVRVARPHGAGDRSGDRSMRPSPHFSTAFSASSERRAAAATTMQG